MAAFTSKRYPFGEDAVGTSCPQKCVPRSFSLSRAHAVANHPPHRRLATTRRDPNVRMILPVWLTGAAGFARSLAMLDGWQYVTHISTVSGSSWFSSQDLDFATSRSMQKFVYKYDLQARRACSSSLP
eukprot:6188222-Pleurochrysis_carterae.AAC.2